MSEKLNLENKAERQELGPELENNREEARAETFSFAEFVNEMGVENVISQDMAEALEAKFNEGVEDEEDLTMISILSRSSSGYNTELNTLPMVNESRQYNNADINVMKIKSKNSVLYFSEIPNSFNNMKKNGEDWKSSSYGVEFRKSDVDNMFIPIGEQYNDNKDANDREFKSNRIHFYLEDVGNLKQPTKTERVQMIEDYKYKLNELAQAIYEIKNESAEQ